MADRYLFVPTVGSILVMLAIACEISSRSRPRQLVVCSGFLLIAAGFSVWAYNRTRVWCGTTTLWNGHSQPDLSLWAAAVQTDPENVFALTNLGRAYLGLAPPEAGKALGYLNRALDLGQASQSRIADNKQLDLTQVYEALGDGYLIQASSFVTDRGDSQVRKKEAYLNAVRSLRKASLSPSGFSSADARVLAQLAEACEALAQMDSQELAANRPEQQEALVRDRDQLRRESEQSMRHAKQILAAGGVTSVDPNYRAVMIGQGNIIFGRETGSTNEERVNYYQEALHRYQEAALLLPDDPRPLLYEGLCYERLTGLTGSSDEKRRTFALGEDVLRKALALHWESPDYSPALPYRALAVLYSHVSDYQLALDSLRNAQRIDPAAAAASHLDQEIHGVEQFLKTNQAIR